MSIARGKRRLGGRAEALVWPAKLGPRRAEHRIPRRVHAGRLYGRFTGSFVVG